MTDTIVTIDRLHSYGKALATCLAKVKRGCGAPAACCLRETLPRLFAATEELLEQLIVANPSSAKVLRAIKDGEAVESNAQLVSIFDPVATERLEQAFWLFRSAYQKLNRTAGFGGQCFRTLHQQLGKGTYQLAQILSLTGCKVQFSY